MAELARARFGDNLGPPLDPPAPRASRGTPSLPPAETIGSYRTITGMPDIGAGAARSRSVGINANVLGHTARDEAMAKEMRARLIEQHPDIVSTGNVGHKPNDALFHAEANALMRAAEPYGGSLAGRTIEMRVDRRLCDSCDAVLPPLGVQIGNPTVRIFDGTGALWIMRDGNWIRRGRP